MKQQGRFNPQFDEYQDAASDFAKPIMSHLRKLVHKQCPEVVEEIKWGIPHFDYKGEMMCIFAAYKNHCSFSFWKESLMSDARLEANPDLKAAKRFMGKLTLLSDLPSDSELIAFIQEAMARHRKAAMGDRPVLSRVPPESGEVDRNAADPLLSSGDAISMP